MKKRKKSFWKKVGITVLCGILCGGGAAGAGIAYMRFNEQKQQKESEKQSEGNNPVTDSNQTESKHQTNEGDGISSVYDVSSIWDNVIPSVVEINVKSTSSYSFFGREYEQESKGSGTGILIAQADELYIVTNQHVVDGATEIRVAFFDGTDAPAKVKGSDGREDIAVLAVQFSDIGKETLGRIKLATIGDSKLLSGGEMVVAIGNATGSGHSLTVGYVSAVNREVEISGSKMSLIQTDAAINPGNSGGPLLNARGELVGINNAKLVASSVEGIGYAIPISDVVSVINYMLNRQEIKYEDSALLGVVCQDVTDTFSAALNMPVGIYIAEIQEGSAAQKAGLPLYGVITEINGIEVKSEEQMREVLRYTPGGSEGTVTVESRVKGEYVPKEYKVVFGTRGKTQ